MWESKVAKIKSLFISYNSMIESIIEFILKRWSERKLKQNILAYKRKIHERIRRQNHKEGLKTIQTEPDSRQNSNRSTPHNRSKVQKSVQRKRTRKQSKDPQKISH